LSSALNPGWVTAGVALTDDFDIKGADSPLERNVSSLKKCVLTENVTYIEAIAAAQGQKTQLFTGGLRKPRFDDILFVSWKKVYDAFWYLNGSYDCDFLRSQKYNVSVPSDVVSMKVGENVFEARRAGDNTSLVTMDVIEKCNNRNLLGMCLNATTGYEDPGPIPLIEGDKIPVESIQEYVSSGMEEPQDVVVQPLKIESKEAVSRFELALVTRPKETVRILSEQMGIEQVLTYIARFIITFINQKDGAEKELYVHGVTGEITW
jgi:hypothetical protein